MSDTDQTTSLRLAIDIAAPPEHAFAVFTDQFDQIKPREYNLLDVDIEETVFETHVGGHVYDRGVDGSVCRWARVLAFEPPTRFVISWDIDAQWRLETDPDQASEVEVRFVPTGPEQTRVELHHRHLERHGAGWQDYQQALEGPGGWPVFLERFRELADRS